MLRASIDIRAVGRYTVNPKPCSSVPHVVESTLSLTSRARDAHGQTASSKHANNRVETPNHPSLSLCFVCLGVAPVSIGSLKTDFTNIPPGTKLTVGSILFKILELPDETVVLEAATNGRGAGEQLQTQMAAKPAAAEAKRATVASAGSGGGDGGGEGDSFSRIEMRVGKITKVCCGVVPVVRDVVQTSLKKKNCVLEFAWGYMVFRGCERRHARLVYGDLFELV